jgi:mRNA-degrading endonuclease toxin of MazEF toxin-antitoxin module
MLRGDVYQAVFDPVIGWEQAGTRPAVIVSREAINRRTAIVVVVPLTGLENKEKFTPARPS